MERKESQFTSFLEFACLLISSGCKVHWWLYTNIGFHGIGLRNAKIANHIKKRRQLKKEKMEIKIKTKKRKQQKKRKRKQKNQSLEDGNMQIEQDISNENKKHELKDSSVNG